MATRKKGGKVVSVRIQIFVKIHKPKSMPVTRRFLDEVVTHWVETGEDLPGTTVNAVSWKHEGKPQRRAEGDDMEQVRDNFLRRLVRLVRFEVRPTYLR